MELQWTDKALADLARLYEFLAAVNKPAAARVVRSLSVAPAGLLANPRIGVDPKGVLFSGGAAFATAGISIIAKGVWDRMFRAEDPCAVAAAEAARLEAGEPASRKRLIPWPRSGR